MGINGTLRDDCLQFWILVKKRVILYTFSQGQFSKLQEIPLADTPLLVSYIDRFLFLQSKESLLVMDLSSPSESTTFKTSLKSPQQACVRLLSSGRVFFSTSPSSFSLLELPSDAPPRATSLSYASPAPIRGAWLSSPFAFVASDALRALDQFSLRAVDSIALPAAALLADAPLLDAERQRDELSVLIAALPDGAVCAVDLLDADATIARFLDAGDVEAAFDLLHREEAAGNTVSPRVSPHSQAIDKRQLHRQACLAFFAQLAFPQAFLHAWEARLPPAEFLQLFPDLLVQPVPAGTLLSPQLLGRNVHSLQDFVVASLKQRSSDPAAIRPDSPAVAAAVETATRELLEFLWKCHAENRGEAGDRVVDAALFRLLLARGDARLAGFLAGPSRCEEADVREALVSRGMFTALAAFYVEKKRPRDALRIWRELGEGALREEGADGVQLTCRFLRRRTEPDTLALMEEFLPWVMERNPDEGYKVVVLGEVSTVPIQAFVLAELARVGATGYRASYIEYLVVMNHVDDPALTTEFVRERIRRLLAQARAQQLQLDVARLADTPAPLREQREQIVSFLESDRAYDAQKVLQDVEDAPLLFEKVLLLGRLRRVEEALRIVVYQLRSIAYACSCCARFAGGAWELLIRILFAEQDEESRFPFSLTPRRRDSFREAALRVLEEHAYEIDPVQVLKIIPDDLSLQQLLQYYQSVVPHSTDLMREARIQRGMEECGIGGNGT